MDQEPPDAERILHSLSEQARALSRLREAPSRIRVSSGDTAIEVEWSPVPANGAVHPPPPQPTNGSAPPEAAAQETVLVTSPMVGTFYRAPEPGAEPYVSVGDRVERGKVIGIIEAMKLMNPVVVEEAGTVAEILVTDAEPVQFGQALIALTPTGTADAAPES
jgi:acetyl-CoA carboxylase biotin carboxyl carrier protein